MLANICWYMPSHARQLCACTRASRGLRCYYEGMAFSMHSNARPYQQRNLKMSVPCAGLDSADLISQLRASHAHDAHSRLGVDVLSGGAGDMSKLGIFESFKVRFGASECHSMAVHMPLGSMVKICLVVGLSEVACGSGQELAGYWWI